MEGSLTESAVQFCGTEPSLSCNQQVNSDDTPFIDHHLFVTWDANEVITQGSYSVLDDTENGDHDHLCLARYSSSKTAWIIIEIASVSVKGAFPTIINFAHTYLHTLFSFYAVAPNFVPSGLKQWIPHLHSHHQILMAISFTTHCQVAVVQTWW